MSLAVSGAAWRSGPEPFLTESGEEPVTTSERLVVGDGCLSVTAEAQSWCTSGGSYVPSPPILVDSLS